MNYETAQATLRSQPKRWLITGVAGFIGSNLLETLLGLGQQVVGLDNFSTGYRKNLDEVESATTPENWKNFTFIEGDIRDLAVCHSAVKGCEYVLHQAALGSVPRSLADPLTTNATNVDGFLNVLIAARDEQVNNFVYAASSSTYGDHPALPKQEPHIGNPLSPYAVTKLVNEIYADVFARSYGTKAVGLRYFNVFGRRQDPNGAYAAVIPQWTANLIAGKPIFINGDGETSRDFCYIDNVVQANILAALAGPEATNEVYNVAVGEKTTLNELAALIGQSLTKTTSRTCKPDLVYRDFRQGDVRHSLADITKAKRLLGYAPTHRISEGMAEAVHWYLAQGASTQ